MLPSGDNEILTRVGPGAPMGNLMRRYWHPVAASVQMSGATVLAVRVLGEDLVLYRDRSGTLGLIERYCAHRRVNLAYGIPEERGLRCMYHGWLYNETGQCIEQPFEETVRPEARFKDKIKLQGYPVQELGGLVWPTSARRLRRFCPVGTSSSSPASSERLLPASSPATGFRPWRTPWMARTWSTCTGPTASMS